MSTKIEWVKNRDGSQGVTWNIFVGCTHSGSPGCDHCYAREMHNRRHKAYIAEKKMPEQYAMPFDTIQFIRERLELPLKWKKPRTIFVNSVSDLFHPGICDEWIHAVYDVMEAAKQHTFIICTKRPERIIPVLYDSGYLGQGDFLPNVWHLTTVENQEWAERRIPELLRLREYSLGWPVLGLSVEPMLGAVDLSKWIMPRTPFTPENAPDTWSNFTWPDWVPKEVREQIEDFWSQFGRKPRDWAENAIHNDSPPFGMYMGYRDERSGETVYGRWIFAWNNMGRLINDDGEIHYPSIPRAHLFDTTRYYWHNIHWVICGGETGPDARPMHPDWVRSLVLQCKNAGVPFFFKQWGEYIHASQTPDNMTNYDPEYFYDREWPPGFAKVGKKVAGRLLDGRDWNEMPEVRVRF